MNKHAHIDMQNESDSRVKALAPAIVSASRATDIPAFLPHGSSTGLIRDIACGRIPIMGKNYGLIPQVLHKLMKHPWTLRDLER